MLSIQVKDASGATQTVQTLPPVGQAAAANSLPVALSTEQQAVLQDSLTAQQASLTAQQSAVTELQGVATNTQNLQGVSAALTPDVALTTPTRGLVVVCTQAGNLSVQFANASVLTFPVNAGISILPFDVTTVVSSGTTATATCYGGV